MTEVSQKCINLKEFSYLLHVRPVVVFFLFHNEGFVMTDLTGLNDF